MPPDAPSDGRPVRRTIRVRWLLAALTAGALVPLGGFAALVVARVAEHERVEIETRLTEASRALGDAVDREMTATFRALAALGGSERLEVGDLAGFTQEAARVAATQPTWVAVVLFDPDGRRRLDTRHGLDGSPAPAIEPGSLRAAVATAEPVVGDLVKDPQGAGWVFALRVPVLDAGKVRWVLTALVSAGAVGEIVAKRAGTHGEWTRTVVDRAGKVVARSRSPERYVGELATPTFVAGTAADDGVYHDVTLDGARAYVSYSHAAVSGWTAAVVASRDVLDAPLRRSLLATVGLGVLVVALSAGGVTFVSRRFSRAIDSAAGGAEALARGERRTVDAAGIAEVTRLGDALARSADLLAARARERDEHLARAEAARADAEAANRTKDEFLAMLGHELRNPLSPIVTALHLLEQRGAGATREHAVIRRQVAHLVRLVDDLLDVSRITRGKIALHVEPVEARTFVAKAVEMATPLLEKRGHRLEVDVPPGLVVHGDPIRLAQIVANLLTNAARYTPPGGNVSVRAARDGERVRIAVEDDGRGLTPELLATLFDPFVQSPRTPDRQEGGLGIGLTLVRSLALLHGGRVEALSDGPGKGATFVVELPAGSPAPRGAREGAGRAAGPTAPLKVLVVDDNVDAAALLAELLRVKGHEVQTAADGRGALEIAERFLPDVAVLDIGLPVMDGYEVAALLRERLGAQAPAMIAMTGYGQPKDHERSRAAGFQAHLVKPADPALLLAELGRIAGERRVSA